MGTGYLIVLVPVRMGAYCGVIHTRKTMNNNQRILTFLAVAAFALTTLFAPWDLTGSPDHINVLRYAPLFAPPELRPWPKRELASGNFLVLAGHWYYLLRACNLERGEDHFTGEDRWTVLPRMKFQRLIFVVLGLVAYQAVAKSTPTNSFGIYLFAESEDWPRSDNRVRRALEILRKLK